MDEKTLTTLEFDKILARLAKHTSFSAGRDLALALRPSADYDEVLRRQRLTAEARHLHEMKPRAGLGGVHDVRALADKANLGGILDPSELLDVATTLEAGRDAEGRPHPTSPARCRSSPSSPSGSATSTTWPPTSTAASAPRAEVVDSASPALAIIRRDLRTVHDRLQAKLQELLDSADGRGVIQEPIITLRDGRYVIPVKAEMRSQMQGIVHDVSASGATVFIEPLAVVELGNTWRETQIEEQREVERILRRLSALVGRARPRHRRQHRHPGGDRPRPRQGPLRRRAGRRRATLRRRGAALAGPAAGAPHLVNARHPAAHRSRSCPISLSVGGDYSVLLITGPNTGGKTVALKTVGLLCAMAQAGLPVPADAGSQLPVFDSLRVDIGDEQSIEQSLSTFSSHMTNIIVILLAEAGPHSLVLLDELGAGTDPDEGSALARAILDHLLGDRLPDHRHDPSRRAQGLRPHAPSAS